MLGKTKVLIIDDSALAREVLRRGLASDPEIEVVGTAVDAYSARDKIVLRKPDVITLDLAMPRMDGLAFLKKLMPQYPLPVVIVSAAAKPGAEATLEALELGAVDYVLKPSAAAEGGLGAMVEELRAKVKVAAGTRLASHRTTQSERSAPAALGTGAERILIAVGASTGGTKAITDMVGAFPPDMPGCVVVQHMPPLFTKLFADRLDTCCRVKVREGADGDRVATGTVLVAPGGLQTTVVRSEAGYSLRCRPAEKVNGHCPSVDVLFESVAKNAGRDSIGVLLTGMGRDGAQGMLSMRRSGARTLAQSEESSVVFGMPKEAFRCGGAERLVHLGDMSATILKAIREMG